MTAQTGIRQRIVQIVKVQAVLHCLSIQSGARELSCGKASPLSFIVQFN